MPPGVLVFNEVKALSFGSISVNIGCACGGVARNSSCCIFQIFSCLRQSEIFHPNNYRDFSKETEREGVSD